MINKSTSCDGSDLLLINFKEGGLRYKVDIEAIEEALDSPSSGRRHLSLLALTFADFFCEGADFFPRAILNKEKLAVVKSRLIKNYKSLISGSGFGVDEDLKEEFKKNHLASVVAFANDLPPSPDNKC